MEVLFFDDPNSPHGIAAHGNIGIPDGFNIADFIGKKTEYEIKEFYSDFPIDEISNEGVLSKRDNDLFFSFRILEVYSRNEKGNNGQLLIIGKYHED